MDPSWNAAEAGSAADAAGPGIPLHQGFAAQAAAVHTAATAPGGGPTHYGARLTQARVFDSGYGAAAHGAAPFASAPASPYEGGAFAYGGAPDPAAYGAAPAATPVYGGGATAWPDVGAGGCHVGAPRGAPRGASGGHHGGAVPGGYQTPQATVDGGDPPLARALAPQFEAAPPAAKVAPAPAATARAPAPAAALPPQAAVPLVLTALAAATHQRGTVAAPRSAINRQLAHSRRAGTQELHEEDLVRQLIVDGNDEGDGRGNGQGGCQGDGPGEPSHGKCWNDGLGGCYKCR